MKDRETGRALQGMNISLAPTNLDIEKEKNENGVIQLVTNIAVVSAARKIFAGEGRTGQ